MNKIIDLRSDTFTLPDDAMRKAIYQAEVGNSAYGEDPSVRQLEEETADYFGFKSGVFLPSATMAGQIAIAVRSQPGDVVIIEEYGHNYYFETGSMAAISATQARLLKGERGILSPDSIDAVIVHPENTHARTSMLILENTSNFGGGTIYPVDTLDEIFKVTDKRALPVHIDGARIWNAIIALDSPPQRLVHLQGSISVCMSKGLGAPMGALLLGEDDFIDDARRIQLMLGGVMRQIGFMAAAALYGFHHNLQRLAEDHANAAFLAQELTGNNAIEIDLKGVQTNMVYFNVKGGAERAQQLVKNLEQHGIKVWALGSLIRLVTSLNVDRQDCEFTVSKLNALIQ